MKTRSLFFLFIILVVIGLTFCEKPEPDVISLAMQGEIIFNLPDQDNNLTEYLNPDLTYGSITDIEGNIYRTIQIGTQEWMAENLKTTKYNDGSPIPFGTGGPAGYTDWFDYGDGNYRWYNGAYCWYDNDVVNKKLGALYNWHAVGTDKLCPTGWHVPAYSEWATFITLLGGSVEPFNDMTENAKIHWGNYVSGFTPVPCGELCGWGFVQNEGCWWTATPKIREHNRVPWAYLLNFEYFGFEPQSGGFNVRCVKN